MHDEERARCPIEQEQEHDDIYCSDEKITEMEMSSHRIHVVQLPREQARDIQIGKPVLTKPNGNTLRRRCEAGKMRKVNDSVSTKGKVSSHRPRWPSLPLRQQTSRRIARLRSGQPGKALDRSASLEARTL